MKKIIFLDVDGTLVDYEGRLPASAMEAVRKALANGHRIYVCTGRSKSEIYPELWDMGLDGMIGGNGSYVEDRGTVVYHRCITMDQCRRAVNWFHSRGIEFYLESNNGLFASEHFEEAAQEVAWAYSSRKGKGLTVREAFPDLIYGGELCRSDLNKISYLLGSYQDFLDTRDQFPDLESHTWGGAGETALFGDLGVKDISKATAVEALLEYLGASRQDTIAFGDAKIDIPMLEYCAVGVAMGSGGPEIRAMADMVTDGVNEDGLLHAFKKLELI